MEQSCCKNCANYRQHYALDNRKLFRVYCGHCAVYPPKRKRPDTKACDRFSPAPPDEKTFASKEYLSKELLKYVLTLKLLPKIEEAEDNIR